MHFGPEKESYVLCSIILGLSYVPEAWPLLDPDVKKLVNNVQRKQQFP